MVQFAKGVKDLLFAVLISVSNVPLKIWELIFEK
jgi:hypothetical protein